MLAIIDTAENWQRLKRVAH